MLNKKKSSIWWPSITVSSVVQGPPTNLYFAKQSKALLGQEECAFAFCLHNNLEHRTSSLKSSCRQTGFNSANNRFPSFLVCKVPQLSVLDKPVGLGQSVCVCLCALLPVWDQRVLVSVGWVLGTGTQTSISVYIWAIIMVLNHGCQKSNTQILSFVPFKKKHQRIKHIPRFFNIQPQFSIFIEKVKWRLRYPAGSKLALSLRTNASCWILETCSYFILIYCNQRLSTKSNTCPTLIPNPHLPLITYPIIVLSLHPVTKLPNSLLTSGPLSQLCHWAAC